MAHPPGEPLPPSESPPSERARGSWPLIETPKLDSEVIPGSTEFGNRYPRNYKLAILKQADACTLPGELGQLLRRSGLTHTTLTCFRKQRASGVLDRPETKRKSDASRSRGKVASTTVPARRILDLERENRALARQLQQASAIIEIQKKVSQLLEMTWEGEEEEIQ